EPHSFDVTVEASYNGQDFRWQFENHEGRTTISQSMAELSGIETETAGPQTLERIVRLHGRVLTDPNRLSQLRARFPGVVQSISHDLGARVKRGETLAVIQSNDSLQNYTLKAPIDGVIVKRNLQTGQPTGNSVLFVIADLSQVWVELDVFGQDIGQVTAGQLVHIKTLDDSQADGIIDWVSPLAEHASQSVRARIVLDNPDGRLRPGQFAHGDVVVEQFKVPLAVPYSAIQRFRDFKVVFARFGNTYEVRMLEMGRRDPQWVEVLGGLEPGTLYVTQNSYLIKADIEKSGAKHAH
ncbi:MAG: efflux RND transporter periplasmic adaptor subunit, partial [Thiohalophilus sp.]